MKKEEKKKRFELTLLVSICIFIILFITNLFSGFIGYLFIHFNLFSGFFKDSNGVRNVIFLMILTSLFTGGFFAYFLSKIPLRPVNYFISQMDRLTKGDFKTRLKKMPILYNYPTVIEVSESFNKLAEELENTEMLRSDFINNFSHEFKTPIVSIAGFAKLLKRGNLTEEQKMEYIDIIEEESLRLSVMATNILNLTKVENQNILTDITLFNLSEQIRNSFLLLEGKWMNKQIDFNIDFDEYTIEGNEELLKQVWINLIDNAIKFTSYLIEVNIQEDSNGIKVSVTNTGSQIPEDKINRIFNKFYQVDHSHSSEGNGIGLALAKAIVELHQGYIQAKSDENKTTFVVTLPKYQSHKQ